MAKNLSDIGPDLDTYIKKFKSKRTMKAIGVKGRDIVKKRTRSGLDSADAPLKELSEFTQRIKELRGSHLGDRTPSKSRLTDTGAMLDGMNVMSRVGMAMIFFRSVLLRNRARKNEEAGRVFFDISPNDSRKLTNAIRMIYRKITNTNV